MMFVSGETAEPSVETTTLIEEIVRQQVIEIVSDFMSVAATTQTTLIFNTARPKHIVGNPSRSPVYFN